MAKSWEEMTQAEKIEDLRRDVVRIFSALREHDDRMTSRDNLISQQFGKEQEKIEALGKRISTLEKGA
jgi:hypothetical protein